MAAAMATATMCRGGSVWHSLLRRPGSDRPRRARAHRRLVSYRRRLARDRGGIIGSPGPANNARFWRFPPRSPWQPDRPRPRPASLCPVVDRCHLRLRSAVGFTDFVGIYIATLRRASIEFLHKALTYVPRDETRAELDATIFFNKSRNEYRNAEN